MPNETPSKRCVLLVVDALSRPIVQRHLDAGDLPNLAMLMHGGGRLVSCLSIFPSITPAATCSIVTGGYPRDHGIEGAYWFDRQLGEVAYFGDDLYLIWERGLQRFLFDFGERLNRERLCTPTLFQRVERRGIDSACVNFMWFAGEHMHSRKTPLLLKLSAGELPESVRGPKFLKLGDFAEALPEGVPAVGASGMAGKYGFNDQTTGECLLAMATSGSLPPLTVGYFPDNDDVSHERGPEQAAREVIGRFDEWLGRFVEAAGGEEQLGRGLEILIVGDHSQIEFEEDGPTAFALDECLGQFQQAVGGKGWRDGDELMICPNMRAAAIYLRDTRDRELRETVIRTLLRQSEVDQVIYEDERQNRCIETQSRGTLRFRRWKDAAEEAELPITDDYGNQWTAEGDFRCIDGRLSTGRHLTQSEYHNALERIDGSLARTASAIWVTAREGVEFRIHESGVHSGGSHGALHRVDSESALITTSGVSLDSLPNPGQPRIIDVAPLCLDVLGIPKADCDEPAHKLLS